MIKAVLGQAALFSGVSAARLAQLAQHCSLRAVKRGERILARGARVPGLYAVASGTLKLSLRHGLDGERVLRLVHPGQTFGLAAALLARPAPYEAHALCEAKVVTIPAAAVHRLMQTDPRQARRILRALAERSLELVAEVEAGGLRGEQRLAAYLDSLAEPSGPDSTWLVRLPATKTVIASRLDMKKETLSRLLRALAEHGVVALAPRGITLLDRERLHGLAAGRIALDH